MFARIPCQAFERLSQVDYRGDFFVVTIHGGQLIGLIQRFLISTFHGGSSKSWAPKNEDGSYATVYARFDNFMVYEGLVLPK